MSTAPSIPQLPTSKLRPPLTGTGRSSDSHGLQAEMPTLPWMGHSPAPRPRPCCSVTENLLSYMTHFSVPEEGHAGQAPCTEAWFINHLYQAHICSAMVRDGIQQLTSNPKGGLWLQEPAQQQKCTEPSGKNLATTPSSGYVVTRLKTSENKIRNTAKIGADLCFGQ